MKANAIQSVASRIKLAQFNTSAWRPTRTHRKESEEENKRHGLNGEASVSVRICAHPALYGNRSGKQGLFSVHDAARSYHDSVTLPTIMDGMRIIPCGREFDHAQQMQCYEMRHDALVAEFVADYDAEKALAPTRLKKLFDPAMWPTVDEVAGKFGFRVRYLPCPVDGEWGDWVAETTKVARLELMDRLVGAGRNLAQICAKDGSLYQATLDNLAEVCELVSDGFNLTDDPVIAAAADSLRKVAERDIEVLRGDTKAKKETANRVDDILETLNGL